MSQLMVGKLKSAAKDKATAPDSWLPTVHGNELFVKTKNALPFVVNNSLHEYFEHLEEQLKISN